MNARRRLAACRLCSPRAAGTFEKGRMYLGIVWLPLASRNHTSYMLFAFFSAAVKFSAILQLFGWDR